MLRIFDRIASGETVYAASGDEYPVSIRKAAHEFQRIVCDEAAVYETVTKRKSVNVQKNELGAFLLPFDSVWFEWEVPHPATVYSNDGVRSICTPERLAVVARSVRDADGYTVTLTPELAHHSDLTVTAFDTHMSIRTDLDGKFVEIRSDRRAVMNDDGDPISVFMPLFITVSWLNMRTFELERVSTPPKVARKRRKSNQPVGDDYYRVVVRPKYRRDWEKRSGTSSTRFHHVIGHPATYTTPLGGHSYGFVGTLWRPGHARGDKSLGTINKEYHVTAEAAQ